MAAWEIASKGVKKWWFRKEASKQIGYIYLWREGLPTWRNEASVMMTEIPKLESDQEEIDTRVVLYCS